MQRGSGRPCSARAPAPAAAGRRRRSPVSSAFKPRTSPPLPSPHSCAVGPRSPLWAEGPAQACAHPFSKEPAGPPGPMPTLRGRCGWGRCRQARTAGRASRGRGGAWCPGDARGPGAARLRLAAGAFWASVSPSATRRVAREEEPGRQGLRLLGVDSGILAKCRGPRAPSTAPGLCAPRFPGTLPALARPTRAPCTCSSLGDVYGWGGTRPPRPPTHTRTHTLSEGGN